jgi:hypothetical protein
MEKSQQRFVVEFFFLKGLGSKTIHRKLTPVVRPEISSLFIVQSYQLDVNIKIPYKTVHL